MRILAQVIEQAGEQLVNKCSAMQYYVILFITHCNALANERIRDTESFKKYI